MLCCDDSMVNHFRDVSSSFYVFYPFPGFCLWCHLSTDVPSLVNVGRKHTVLLNSSRLLSSCSTRGERAILMIYTGYGWFFEPIWFPSSITCNTFSLFCIYHFFVLNVFHELGLTSALSYSTMHAVPDVSGIPLFCALLITSYGLFHSVFS